MREQAQKFKSGQVFVPTIYIYSTMPGWFGEMLNAIAATKEFRNNYAEEKKPKNQKMEGAQ